MIVESPSYEGVDQKRLICVGDTAVAVRFVGGFGTVAALAWSPIEISIRIEDSSKARRFTNKNRQNRLINTRIKLLANWVKSVLVDYRDWQQI